MSFQRYFTNKIPSSTTSDEPPHHNDNGIPSRYPGVVENVDAVEQIQHIDIGIFQWRFDNA